MEPDFKEGDQALVSALNFNNLKGPKKMRYSFLGPFTIIKPIGKNEVKVKLMEEFSRKHPVFQVSLVKPYFQAEEDKFPSRKNNPIPPEIVEVEDTLALFKNQTADKPKWFAPDAIQDWNLHLRRFRASRKIEQSHK
ncbi:hypothetical protein O181_043571 [Austropuccinia psidii MF-1]|uniref:Tf2-1-like SH3-like domain-containing protein n=1 Tax=Austropuccinia psidii MF-1 TaxID=1389203 RepID=A0A9Q3DNR9_9BASI|nr:hypothetical protein [Austropuccinia psidii MF-1]